MHGDCADVLRGLLAEGRVAGLVRLAYLDPPFNTHERSREYHDSFAVEAWTAFLAERVELVWRTLRGDGSLWLHCDDREQATARVLLDGLVGRDRHVATVVWQRRGSRENRRAFSTAHDYLHVYAPAGPAWKAHRNRLARQDPGGLWRNPDGDPRGPWSTVSLVAQGGHATAGQVYPIALPSGRTVEPPQGSCWRVVRARLDELVAAGEVWFGPRGDNVPRRKVYQRDAKGLVPSTWWTHDEVGHNAEANGELRRLFRGRAPFSTPKPERLLLRILQIATDPGELVLDPFLGSGTTAAVAHKCGRRWIGIEASAATLDAFARPRLEAVVAGEDAGGVSRLLDWRGGGGFEQRGAYAASVQA